MKRNVLLPILLTAVALGMLGYARIGRTGAYFTSYTEAAGGYTLHLGDREETTGKEEFSAWTKRLAVANQEAAEPVFVRAKAFCSSLYTLTYSDREGHWSSGDEGYWYYDEIVPGGEVTEELLIKIGNVPENAKTGDGFHVVVVYECTPVRYREDGTPYADWGAVLDRGETEGGAGE